MQKRDDSLRSLGIATIAVDKQLREDIKTEAARQGYSRVSDYLRVKVAEDKKGDQQGIMLDTGLNRPATKADINKLESILKYLIGGGLDTDIFNLIGQGPKQGYSPVEFTPETIARQLQELSDKAKKLSEIELRQSEMDLQES